MIQCGRARLAQRCSNDAGVVVRRRCGISDSGSGPPLRRARDGHDPPGVRPSRRGSATARTARRPQPAGHPSSCPDSLPTATRRPSMRSCLPGTRWPITPTATEVRSTSRPTSSAPTSSARWRRCGGAAPTSAATTRAVGGELANAVELVAEVRGLGYDSSLMDADTPYRLGTPMGEIIELCPSWSLDDWVRSAFLPGPDIGATVGSPRAFLPRVVDARADNISPPAPRHADGADLPAVHLQAAPATPRRCGCSRSRPPTNAAMSALRPARRSLSER